MCSHLILGRQGLLPLLRRRCLLVLIAKNVLTGNLLNDPDRMTAIANIYAKHGVVDKMLPWMNQAYQAKKTGIVDALPFLLAGDGENAAMMLRKSGMNIEGVPQLVDKANHVWKFNIGGQPREINVRDIALMANPEKAIELEQNKELKAAQVDAHKANAEKDRAMAKAYSAGSLRAGRRMSSGGLTPIVRRTVETDQGIVAIMSDGTKQVIADDNGTPLFGTSGQKIAAGLVGKTLSPMDDNGDIAGKVNSLTGQLQARRQPKDSSEQESPESANSILQRGDSINGR
jgi:hypothetical protein